MAEENIMRVEHQGLLYRLVPDSLLKRAQWKESWAVLYTNNATLYFHKDDSVKSKVVSELDLKPTVLWMAFGQDAYKYRAAEHKSSHPDELIEKYGAENLIAIPKDKNGHHINWLAAKDRPTLRQWIKHFANCLKIHSNPPMLSNRRGDEDRVRREVVRKFGLVGNEDDWEIYWLYTLLQAEQKSNAESAKQQVRVDKIRVLEKENGNLTEFGTENVDPRSMAEKIFEQDMAVSGWDNEFRSENRARGQISYHVTRLENGWQKTEIIVDVGAKKFDPDHAEFIHKDHEDSVDVKILRKYVGNVSDGKGDFYNAVPVDSHITHTHMIEKISQF